MAEGGGIGYNDVWLGVKEEPSPALAVAGCLCVADKWDDIFGKFEDDGFERTLPDDEEAGGPYNPDMV